MHSITIRAFVSLALGGVFLVPRPSRAAEEACESCDLKVTFSGDFQHVRARGAATFLGAPAGRESSFREALVGPNFNATFSGLPDDKYSVVIGEVEVDLNITGRGQRVFDISSGQQVLAKGYDIFAEAGGSGRVVFLTNTVQHQADSLGGPLVLTFTAQTGQAKFNSIEVFNSAGRSMYYVTSVDLVDVADPDLLKIPVVNGPEIWKDPTKSRDARVKDLVSRMTMMEKIHQMANNTPRILRLGVPAYNYWSEALHGVARTPGPSTVFPQAIGNAATWDTDMLKQVGNAIGVEARAKFNYFTSASRDNSILGLTFWSPNINIYRDPRWGRGQETYGEDTFLTSRMGVAFIEGMQGHDPNYLLAMACAKHYAVHSGPEPLRHAFDAEPSERDLYETYLPHFEAAVREAHVGSVMSAYNAVYGQPVSSSTFLLQDILREKWGFDGHVVSDCDAVGDIWRNHHTVSTAAEAAAMAVKAGCDLCCGQTYNSLNIALRSNLVIPQQIDLALGHLLDARFRLGLFDPPAMVSFNQIPFSENDSAAHRQLALDMARESIVLLKNEGLLPLNRSKLKRISIFGANATDTNMLFGNYNGFPSTTMTILEGISNLAGKNIEIAYAMGCPLVTQSPARGSATVPARSPAELRADALLSAANADVLIYVGGITPQLEGEEGSARAANGVDGFRSGDRTSIELPQVQEEFLHALQATGKPVIFINCSGGAMAMPWEAEHLPAILQVWYPGEEGARAIAEVLFGDSNPSGRLPVTFYRSTADLPEFTNYSMANRTYRYFTGSALFAFGRGLSYTKFEYSTPTLAATEVKSAETIKLTLTVKNAGGRDGDEVPQVYFRHLNSSVPQPIKALCSFGRVHLAKGQSARMTFEIPVERFRYWDTTRHDYVVEPGQYELMIGAASDDIRQTARIHLVR